MAQPLLPSPKAGRLLVVFRFTSLRSRLLFPFPLPPLVPFTVADHLQDPHNAIPLRFDALEFAARRQLVTNGVLENRYPHNLMSGKGHWWYLVNR